MRGKLVVTETEPLASEWRIQRLDIIVDIGEVWVTIVSDSGVERAYKFNDNTSPTGREAMTAINNHNGSEKLLNIWIIEELQKLDNRLVGSTEE